MLAYVGHFALLLYKTKSAFEHKKLTSARGGLKLGYEKSYHHYH